MAKTVQNLTLKQENFCKYYVDTDGNASEAYRMAYDADNMKVETIWSNASRLLNNSKVTARVNEIRRERAVRSEIKRENVERVLMDIVTADVSDLYQRDENSGRIKIKDPTQMPKNLRNALKSIKNDKGKISYEFNGKTEAARLLGAWNGWNAPQNINMQNSPYIGELRIGFDDDED